MALIDFDGLGNGGTHAPYGVVLGGGLRFERRPGVTSVHGVHRRRVHQRRVHQRRVHQRRVHSWRVRSWSGRLAVLTGLFVLPAAGVTAAGNATADTRPNGRTTPATVSADALPTVQIDGVVW